MIKKSLHFSVWSRIIAAGLLFWALDNHEYGYYIFLRWTTCGVAAYFAYVAYENSKNIWTWILGAIALIFNPIIPFHLDRNTWFLIDLISGGLMLLSLFFVSKPVKARYSDDITGACLHVKKVMTSEGLQNVEGRGDAEGRQEVAQGDKGPQTEAPKAQSYWDKTPGDILSERQKEQDYALSVEAEVRPQIEALEAEFKTAKRQRRKDISEQIAELEVRVISIKVADEDFAIRKTHRLVDQAVERAHARGLVDEDRLDDFAMEFQDAISDQRKHIEKNRNKKVSDIFEEVLRDYIEAPVGRH